MKHRSIKYMGVFAVCLLLQACGGARKSAQVVTVVAPHSTIEGAELGEWSSRWWQWAFSATTKRDPVRDLTGAHCTARQSGPVWFLAGSYETDKVIRSCTVPADTYVFFPLINFQATDEEGATSCADLADSLNYRSDSIVRLYATIDGKAVPDLESRRERSPRCFDPYEFIGGDSSGIYITSSDGFWIMLEPLPTGPHVLTFGGEIDGFTQDITYNLEVK
jgi:hypothetical protein